MGAPWFIGDEVTAAGMRLAGAQVHVPSQGADAGELTALLHQARAAAELVLLGADVAAALPAAERERALAATSPLTVIVPDVRGQAPLPDLEQRVRTILGVEQ